MRSPAANFDQRTAYGFRVILDKIQRSALAPLQVAERRLRQKTLKNKVFT
jgi:hypothetical protein